MGLSFMRISKSESDPPELKSGDGPLEEIPRGERRGGRLAQPTPYGNISITRLKRIYLCCRFGSIVTKKQ